ncbi:fimbria/pilus outer membrane usher protein [Pseudomonas sp. CCI3.2]|uniref:fimbria/pilus outer membrane usher protein n=2 Tax=unclassified Pseudomonas TaxID=196821 RepID=UPI002AC9DC5C|nr:MULTISPECIES: fimbria/pilus outer membrane usher protein [unclassified Pseudomonas]MEB0078798.1 fimbria/pilus outer membrane usher protein [Pseudomonas sp. MH10out]MEB0089703.1 fimbria/pilus outer membrane usher protein [Pseudomonas sp. CCI4.2]MEB0103570.1 fimbria/pilus outer membrane usher protein [Pseudomonas sp. CCI3.2]MEB0128992.1 fimbria/pilus outer membrane usher protein [Pseudomonas sp. CCI2.4]MEB0160223.1 fimbria/pilus outer membrane usher protein [Pseudomonas sp. AH2 (2023)]
MASMTALTATADQASTSSPSAPVTFNTAFIQGTNEPADLEEFLRGNSVLPGTYSIDVYVNRTLAGRRDIRFVQSPTSKKVEPCLTLDMLQSFGLDIERLQQASDSVSDGLPTACFDLPTHLQFARVEYQPNSLRLSISVPQAAMARSARGYVEPELWDEGDTAAFINYNFSAVRRHNQQEQTDQYYLGLRNGFNLGAWRLRNESSLTYGGNQPYRFASNRTYAQRDLTALRSQLTLGEVYSNSLIFDSVRFRGAAIDSDDGMLPDSERVYAPTIRGIAETNATVEVRQNGYLLYSSTVSPGPFEISDIYPSGSNGDLLVTVVEANGSTRSFTQTFASLPIMIPQGALRYSFALGQYDSNSDYQATPAFTTGTLVYGVSERLTGFGGVQWAQDYQAGNLGAGINSPVGAFSADLTQSISEIRAQSRKGQSVRLRYANTLDMTRTTFAVAGYRYSTDQFRTLEDHVDEQAERIGQTVVGRAKDRLEVNISQSLPAQSGSLSLTASDQRYWNLPGKTRQLFLSYNAAWKTISYSLSVERNQQMNADGQANTDHRLSVGVTVPLGSSSTSSRASFNLVRDSGGDYNAQAGLNGQMLEDRNSFYSVQAGHDRSAGSFGSGKLTTTKPYGRFEAGYSQGRDYDAMSLGASGSLVGHSGGINFGQPLGETFALVQVPQVKGAKLTNYNNVETSANGYAVLPYAQPYRTNWVALDTRRLGADIDVEDAIVQVVPRRGAVSVVHFNASIGRRVQFELVRADGSKVPLGATVEDEQGKPLAVVDPTSRALVLSDQDAGVLRVKWSDQSCQVPYRLPPKDPARAYERLKVTCQ